MSSPNPTIEDEDDPIEHTYSVFIKPPLPQNRRLLVLQHPNTQSDDPHSLRAPPVTGMRLKSGSGMLEADVPLDYNVAYDRHKGIVWGSALQKTTAAKTSLGLSGGFGIGGAPARTRGRAAAGDDHVEGGDWTEALRTDKVLRTQTLGGLSMDTTEARYLVAVFQGKNVHLTPVSSLAHLRPQLHHIDAATDLERISRASANASAGAGGPGGKEATSRAIHMTIKSTADGEEVVQETIADRLRAVQLESWKKMEYADEDTEDAWFTYQESLLLQTDDKPDDVVADPKGKQPAVDEEAVVAGTAGASDLDERVPGLGTDWGEDELLRAVSGIKATDKKPGEEAVSERADPSGKTNGKAALKDEPVVKAEKVGEPEPAKRAGRPRKNPASAAAVRRGRSMTTGRGEGSAAMDVD